MHTVFAQEMIKSKALLTNRGRTEVTEKNLIKFFYVLYYIVYCCEERS